MYDQRIYRYYGRPKRYRDPRRSKMLDHRRRGRHHDKAGASVRRLRNRAMRKRWNQKLRAAIMRGDYDVLTYKWWPRRKRTG